MITWVIYDVLQSQSRSIAAFVATAPVSDLTQPHTFSSVQVIETEHLNKQYLHI